MQLDLGPRSSASPTQANDNSEMADLWQTSLHLLITPLQISCLKVIIATEMSDFSILQQSMSLIIVFESSSCDGQVLFVIVSNFSGPRY